MSAGRAVLPQPKLPCPAVSSRQEGRVFSYEILPEDIGKRIQDYLMKRQGYSVRLIRRLKQVPGAVCLSGGPVRMIDRLQEGSLTVILPPDSPVCAAGFSAAEEPAAAREAVWHAEAVIRRVPVLYEDEDVTVYNKPPFLAIHPCRDYQRDTLAEVFLRDMRERGAAYPVFRPVYRLDRDTDGLCVIAKNPLAAAKLARAVEKDYTAIACGRVEPITGSIDAPIAQLLPHRMKRGVREDGQRAVTHYEVLAYGGSREKAGAEPSTIIALSKYAEKERKYTEFMQSDPGLEPAGYTLLRLRLETGRTHQIRVHFSHIGHPLAGDLLYGGAPSGLTRQALSCTRVAFQSPATGKHCEICINMQSELTNLLQNE